MAKPEIKIERWFVIGNRLYGEITDHPVLGDCRGGNIATSSIERIETRNSIYVCGEPARGDERTKMLVDEDTAVSAT